jgi:hypothetical protein
MASLGVEWTEQQRISMADALAAMAIWPEDYDALAARPSDVLVAHETDAAIPRASPPLSIWRALWELR